MILYPIQEDISEFLCDFYENRSFPNSLVTFVKTIIQKALTHVSQARDHRNQSSLTKRNL